MKEILLIIFLTASSIVSATTYYVSTTGKDTNPGTITQPWATWQKGFSSLVAGDILYIRGGTYSPAETVHSGYDCGAYAYAKDGSPGKLISVLNYPGETPIMNASNVDGAYVSIGVFLSSCDYWYIKGLTIQNTPGFGMELQSCTNITVEQSVFRYNVASGFRVFSASDDVLVLNCDAYGNQNPANPGSPDGFEASNITYRAGDLRLITFRGCRSWNNSDDGFDHWNMDGYLLIDGCWAWRNGWTDGGLKGDGDGFKLGTTSLDMSAVYSKEIRNSVSFNNRLWGISQNQAKTKFILYNNTVFNNPSGGINLWWHDLAHIVRNNASFSNVGVNYNGAHSKAIISNNNYDAGWQPTGPVASSADFVSVTPTGMDGARQADGSLPIVTFLHLKAGSDLIDAGMNVSLTFSGKAPDIGAFETSTTAPVVVNKPPVVSISSPLKSASFTAPASITINATASDPDGTITKVEFYQGTLKIGEKTTTPYSIIWKDVPEGSYSLTAVATDNKASKTVSVAVSITVVKPAPPANKLPTVSISSPATSSSFTSPASITVEATASDPDGAITKVEFYQGTVKLGEKTTLPYTLTWKDVSAGTYSLTAVATDNANSKTVSAAVSITVVSPPDPVNKVPIVSISSPTKGSPINSPATVTIDVNASDPDGSITKVELFNGDVKLYEKTTAPYSFTLKDLPAGSYELKAVATDNLEAAATSPPLALTVTPIYEARDYFNLYPNPNDGRFSIEFTTLMEADIFTITVVDLIGKTVYKEEISRDQSTRQFDLSHLNSGIYVLMITADQILLTQKFIKGKG